MANFSFYIQIELDNPFQVATNDYSYIYASQDDAPSLQIVEEFELADGIANELENYYEGSITEYTNVYPKYRGPGGGGISASSFLPAVSNFAGPYSPNGYLRTIEFNFDADKINAVAGSIDKIATDVKKIIEGVFTNATASTKEIYLDPIFTYYTSKRASNSPTSSNGQQNNRYTPHGKTFSFPLKPVYQKIKEEKKDSTYNIRYKLSGIITIEDWEKNYKSLADSSRKQYGVNTQTQQTPQTGLSPSGQTPSQTTTPPQTPSTQTLSVSGDTQTNGLTPSGMSPSAAGLTPSGMTPSPPPEPPIKGVFVLNIEKPGILSCTALGELTITQKELGAEDFFYFGEETDYVNEEVDEEYSEGAFAGAEEDLAFELAEGTRLSQGQELLANLNIDDPNVANSTQGDNGDPNKTSEVTVNTVARGKIKKMLEVAKGELGYTEKRNEKLAPEPKKDTKYGVYWGLNGHHYCGMFVCWCAEHAGMKVTNRDSTPYKGNMPNSIACPTGVNIFKSKDCFVSNGNNKAERSKSTIKPEPGDIVFFAWKYGTKADHVGIVVEDLGNGKVKCYEGNTSPGKSGANQTGSGCWERDRAKEFILGYGKTALWDPTNLDEFTGKAGKAGKSA
jgi:hypothetical protein